jgi:Flp pilus assembly protein TadG
MKTLKLIIEAMSGNGCTRTRGVRRGGERGQALAELALMLPMFSALLVGAAEFARVSYAAIEVANAARAGAAYGAQNHLTALSSATMQSIAQSDAPNVTNLTAVASTFCTCSNGTAITCANAATTCSARVIPYVKVVASASVNPLFHVPGLPTTYNLQSTAQMRVEQ